MKTESNNAYKSNKEHKLQILQRILLCTVPLTNLTNTTNTKKNPQRIYCIV